LHRGCGDFDWGIPAVRSRGDILRHRGDAAQLALHPSKHSCTEPFPSGAVELIISATKMSAHVRCDQHMREVAPRLVYQDRNRGSAMSGRSSKLICTLTLVFCMALSWAGAYAQANAALQQTSPTGPAATSFYSAEIPKSDLQMTDNPDNPGASAMILERTVYTDDEKRFQTEFVRIKIFKEDGTKYADISVPYLAKQTTVEDIRGRTVRADGTVIEFNGTVYDSVVAKTRRVSYQAKTFTLPGAEPGAVIEYSYTMRWKYRYPSYVGHPNGYIFDGGWTIPSTTWTIQNQLFTRHAIFQLRPVPGGNLNSRTVRLTQGDLLRVGNVLKLEVSNVAPLPEEEAMPPEQMVNSRVHLYYVIGWSGSQWYSFGKMMEQEYQKFVTPNSFLTRLADEIAPRDLASQERLHRLYSRVQQLRFLSDEPIKSRKELSAIAENKSAEDILRHGYAFNNEANLLFTALARAAGFDANVVQVTDRREALFDETLPDSSQLNAMIVMVRLVDKTVYLDPAAHFCPYGQIPWYESDTGGVAWSKNGGFVVKVPYESADKALTERTADLVLQADGTLSGDVEIVFHGQEALERKQDAVTEDVTGRNKQIEDEVKSLLPPGTAVEALAVTGWQTADEPLRVKCHINIPSYASVGAQRILFSPAVFQSQRRASFSSRIRTQPVYYRHLYENKDRVTITIPNKYRVEALPHDSATGAAFARCEVKRSFEQGRIVMDRHEQFNGYFFPTDLFSTLWTYRVKVRRGDAEKVVLHVAD
jgi:hypothetical protein